MKVLVLVALIVASALARPDVSHLKGYNNYSPPATSYGVPLNSRFNSEDRQYYSAASHHGQQGAIPSGSYLPSLSGGQSLSNQGGANFGLFGGQISSGSGLTGQLSGSSGGFSQKLDTRFGSSQPGSFGSQGATFGSQGGSFGSQGGSFGSQGGSFGSQGATFGSQGATFGSQGAKDLKHYYFYAAPDEPQEEVRPRVIIPPASAEKHTKIVFIKAPTFAARAPAVIAPAPQKEEKTVVYVLVKKPDELQDIHIPAAPATPPTKPEVYFIRYNSKQEAEQAISGSLRGAAAQGSISIHPSSGSEEFISQFTDRASGGNFGFNVNRGGFSDDSGSISSGGVLTSFGGNTGSSGGSGSSFGGNTGSTGGVLTSFGGNTGSTGGTGSLDFFEGSTASPGGIIGTSVTGAPSSGSSGSLDFFSSGSTGGSDLGSIGGSNLGSIGSSFETVTGKPSSSGAFFGSGSSLSSTDGHSHDTSGTSTNFLTSGSIGSGSSTQYGPAGETGPY